MRRLANRIKPGMPVLLAYLDNREHSKQDLQRIESIANKYNIEFVDTSSQFKSTRIDDYSIHLLDSHPDGRAQEMFANTLFDYIEKQHVFGFNRAALP